MDDKNSLTLKEWANEDKPREKLISKGKKELSNAELIAILLRSGLPGKSAIEMAKEILLDSNNSLTELSRMEYSHLASRKGMGIAKAATLLAALELGWRMQGEMRDDKELIVRDSVDLFNLMLPMVVDLDHEEFWVAHLNNRNKLLGRQRIAMGGQTETTVDLRMLFRSAIESKATAIAVVHNHPSGSLKPSRQDRDLTRRIQEAGTLLGIRLTDHLIVAIGPQGMADYYSFRDGGLL